MRRYKKYGFWLAMATLAAIFISSASAQGDRQFCEDLRASKNYIAAAQCYLSLTPPDNWWASDQYGWAGNIAYTQGDYNAALDYYLLEIQYAELTTDYKIKGEAHYHTGQASYELGDLEGSKNYYLQAADDYIKLPDNWWAGDSFGWAGNIAYAQGGYKAALDYYLLEIQYTDLTTDFKKKSSAYYHAGQASYELGDFEGSMNYYLQAAYDNDQVKDNRWTADSYGWAGNAADANGDCPNATKYWQLAKEYYDLFDANGNPYSTLSCNPTAAVIDTSKITHYPNPIHDEEITFDGSQSVGSGLTYQWDFPDDVTQPNTGPNVPHTFKKPGKFTVTLTVTDGNKNQSTATAKIQILSIEDILGSSNIYPKGKSVLHSDFSFTPTFNFGFTPKEAASIGRYDKDSGTWITYDHFNWVQEKIAGFTSCTTDGDCYDPPINISYGGALTDPYIGFWDDLKMPQRAPQHYFDFDPKVYANGSYFRDLPNLGKKGLWVTFKTYFVGVHKNQNGSFQYDDKKLLKVLPSEYMFYWVYHQIADDPCAELAYWMQHQAICLNSTTGAQFQILQNIDPALAGNGIINILSVGTPPDPNAELFPYLRPIDVIPGDAANKIDLQTAGEIPVAILSTAKYSAELIDPATVRLGRSNALPNNESQIVDVNEDGLPDLLFYFYVQDAGIVCTDTSISLTGKAYAGDIIAGIDSIKFIKCGSIVTTTASGLAFSRVSQTFNGTVAIKNISSSTIFGPFQIFFTELPSNVTLVNATRDLSGTPYLTVPYLATLAPGQSAKVSVKFKNPSNATINFTPVTYSGSID